MSGRRILSAALILALAVTGWALAGGVLHTRAQGGQNISIGVMGGVASPTLRGVSLAVDQLNAQAPTLPDGSPFSVTVVAVEAGDQIQAAVNQLKGQGAVAIFGPDDDTLAAANGPVLSVAGVPIFSGATTNELRPGGFVFRTRAADNTRMIGLADALINDARATKFAIYQGGQDAASATSALVIALAQRSLSATPVLQDPARPVSEAAAVLLQGQPDAIAAFGTPEQITELYTALKASGFAGRFATDLADDRAFIEGLPAELRAGIYGVTAWTYAYASPRNQQFIQNYLAAFGEIPSALAAASYDAANMLLGVIQKSGANPAAILAGILALGPFETLQGAFNPGLGNGELTQTSTVIETNASGAPKIIARFSGANRLPDEPLLLPTETPFVAQPPPTLALPPTIPPTPTPQGVVATIISPSGVINVRYGPGTVYAPPIGRLTTGTQVQLLGAAPGYQWFTINYNGQLAWISGDPTLVSIFGDITTLPIVPVPPTPTPAATATPTPPPAPVLPDLVLVSAFLSMNPVKLGTAFSLTVTIFNRGQSNAGNFAVAATLNPGGKFGAVNIPGLAAGQQISVTINYPPLEGSPGTYTEAIVIDLNSEVNEGPEGEANNKPTITYQVVP